MLGIENLKKVLTLICALANVGDKIGHETAMTRWGKLFELVGPVAGIGSIDWSMVGKEFADLDAVERAALEQQLKQEFDLVDDKLEEVIESAVFIAEDLVAIFDRIKALKA